MQLLLTFLNFARFGPFVPVNSVKYDIANMNL